MHRFGEYLNSETTEQDEGDFHMTQQFTFPKANPVRRSKSRTGFKNRTNYEMQMEDYSSIL